MRGLLLKSFIKDKLSECLDLVTELEMRSSSSVLVCNIGGKSVGKLYFISG